MHWEQPEMTPTYYTNCCFEQRKAPSAVKKHQRRHQQKTWKEGAQENKEQSENRKERLWAGHTLGRNKNKRDSNRKTAVAVTTTYIVAQDKLTTKSWLGITAWQDAECLLNVHSSLQNHDLHLAFWYETDWHYTAFHKFSIMLKQLSSSTLIP